MRMPSSDPRSSSRGAAGDGTLKNNQHPNASNASSGNGSDQESIERGNIRVVVRIRPPNTAEREAGPASRQVVQMLDDKVLVFDPKEDAAPSYFHGRRVTSRNFRQRKNKDMKFAFDHVFGEENSQQFVYENTTKTIVDSVLAGYNASVFAYGATGAGKTFTMLGGPECPGVIFLTMVDLYRRIGEIAADKLCEVAVSYLEVYNENIRDLLVPGGMLALRENPQKGVMVNGLTLHKPKSAEELLRMLAFGNSNRTQHPTDANAQSSRSHAVFQVFVRQKDRTANISTNFHIAKMTLIDLAGSERATVTTNRGSRFREGANINRSLLALGNCINALADGNRSKGQHIPYRDSKLTRLLKDSLGGNCKTVMIAAVSPSSLNYEDTLNTLKYANRAKNIQIKLKQNVVNVDLHISHYRQVVAQLRTEITELKGKLQSYESGAMKVDRLVATPADNEERTDRLQLDLHEVFTQRRSIRKELLELESSDRHLAGMITRKQSMAERVRVIYVESTHRDKTMDRFERHIAASSTRQARLRNRKPAVEERLRTNEEWLENVKGQMKGDREMPLVLQESLRTRHLEIELKDCHRQIKHLKRFARQQDDHQQSSERLILNLLATVRKQFYLLKGSGLATSDVVGDFEAVQKQVVGDREVAWADQNGSEVAGSEVKPGGATEPDLNYLLEIPVMKCVNVTPKAPCGRDAVSTPPSRVLTPNSQPATNAFQPIVEKTPSSIPRNTAHSTTPQSANVCNTGLGHAIPQCIGQTVTKTKPDYLNPLLLVVADEEPKRNLVGTFEMEGICPLKTSERNASWQPERTTVPGTVDCSAGKMDLPKFSSLNATFSADHTTSSHHSAKMGAVKPVARAISFAPENSMPNQKISPITGRIMSYAQAVTTPQRLDASSRQRAPLAALMTNSPQLEDRAVKAPQRLSIHAGNQGANRHQRLQTFGRGKSTPSYMSMTASSVNKRRNFTRGFLASQENIHLVTTRGPGAMRVHKTLSKIKPAVRIPTFSK